MFDLAPERAVAATVMMLSCCAAMAGEVVDGVAPDWTLSGFGTLAAVHSNNDQADFTANAFSPGAAGYSRAWSAHVDSRLGAQLWVRPPVEVYGAIPLSSSAGVDASCRWQGGGMHHTTQVFFGRADIPATPSARARAHGLMVFTGRGRPPRELPNSAAARRMVADNPALIAYIDKSALDSSVKAIQVTP